METTESSSSPSAPSEKAVALTMQQGLQDILLQTVGGVIIGGLSGIVLARGGGGGSSARKVLAGLGGGVGFGAAWTRTSMNLEELLSSRSSGGSN